MAITKLYNFRTRQDQTIARGDKIDPADCVPQDPIAQNLLQHLMVFQDTNSAISDVLIACAARMSGRIETAGDYSVATFGEAINVGWMSVPLKHGQTAGVVCQHCGGFCPIEQAPDGDPVEIVYQPEALYPAADQVGPVAED